ncbi:aldehyde dehydrogenase family protein [Burkholderia sp. D-99]|uniref:aldehyde dehydrogenase family protein n=1 Tax=Burkholderia sp. D-99 TaxID=2717316 RepID=UPI003260A2B6
MTGRPFRRLDGPVIHAGTHIPEHQRVMRLERPGRGVLRASRNSRLLRKRIFGPVLSVTTFIDIGDAIALANDSVYTGALNRAIRLSRDSRAGVVTVNGFDEGDVPTPFDGYQDPGFGGRDKSVRAHDPYPGIKIIRIDVPADPAQAGCMALPLSAAQRDGCNRIIPFAVAARAGATESPEIEFEC